MSLVWETKAENTDSRTGQNERRVAAETFMSKMLSGHIQIKEALGRRQPWEETWTQMDRDGLTVWEGA